MARKNWFIGKSQEWLEAELNKAQSDLAAGKTLTGWSQGGDSASKQVQLSAQERITELLYSLSQIDGETYPIDSIIGNSITGVDFSNGQGSIP